MNPCLWFLVVQEFDTLQTSSLKRNRRLKQRDSLPLNAAREAGGSEVPSVVRGKAPVGGLGHEVTLKLKLLAHLHIIFCIFLPYARFFRRSKWPNDKYASTPPQFSPSPLPPSFPFPGKRRVRGSSMEKIKILDCCSVDELVHSGMLKTIQPIIYFDYHKTQ